MYTFHCNLKHTTNYPMSQTITASKLSDFIT